jgi:hypothetical protein
VIATAEGGSNADVTNTMRVGDGEYDCTTSEYRTFVDPDSFLIPLPGEEKPETVVASSSEYFSEDVIGCTRTYSLELENGDPAPDYFDIDPTTGVITLTNSGDRLVSDSIVVKILSTDGVEPRIVDYGTEYPVEYKTAAIAVSSICGLGSSVVTAPVLDDLSQPSNYLPNEL